MSARAAGALLLLGVVASLPAPAEEPALPRGERLILEGRFEEAVAWYRARGGRDPDPEWREGLAEALASRGADLLAHHRTEEAEAVLEEAARLSEDPERLERVRHLRAYAAERTTGHATHRGLRALARGDIEGALHAYDQAGSDALDAMEARQAAALVTYTLLLRALIEPEHRDTAEAALARWPRGGGAAEDAEQFLWAARLDRSLRERVRDGLDDLEGDGSPRAAALRAVGASLLLQGDRARAAAAPAPTEWREPLDLLARMADRLKRRPPPRVVDPPGADP